jgi:hypothetical protein
LKYKVEKIFQKVEQKTKRYYRKEGWRYNLSGRVNGNPMFNPQNCKKKIIEKR